MEGISVSSAFGQLLDCGTDRDFDRMGSGPAPHLLLLVNIFFFAEVKTAFSQFHIVYLLLHHSATGFSILTGQKDVDFAAVLFHGCSSALNVAING